MRPSEEEAIGLHRKYGSSDKVVTHCRTVAKVSFVLADEMGRRGKKVDSEVAVSAALLHDIGRTRTQTVRHGFEGSQILIDEDVEEVIAEAVRRHVGAGISAEEAKTIGLPDLDYIPRTLEEVIVCFADKMVDSDRVRPFKEEVKRFEMKGHDVPRLLALRKRIEEELGEDPEIFLFEKFKESG